MRDVHDYNKVIRRADHNPEWRITISLYEILATRIYRKQENNARYSDSYNGTLIGNHMRFVEWCHFRLP